DVAVSYSLITATASPFAAFSGTALTVFSEGVPYDRANMVWPMVAYGPGNNSAVTAGAKTTPHSGIDNLVANASFEAGTSGDATSWTEGSDHARTSCGTSADGLWTLRSQFAAAASGTATRSAPIAVTPYTDYRLGGWIFNNLDSGKAYLDLSDVAGEAQP